jgi:Sap, sulfolipid-1-addressing protein
MGNVIFLSFVSVLNPTLIAVTTVMLLLPHPGRLMLGYWLGGMITSITLGLLVVFSLEGSSAASTTKKTLSPLADIVLGGLLLVLALMLARGGHKRLAERRAKRNEGKKSPKWQRALRKGTARTTFVIGALLTLPGASYLAGLDRLSKLHYSTAATVLVVICFNLVMLILLEGPMIAFVVAPDWTPSAIDRAKAWARTRGRQFAVRGLAVIGGALAVKGIIGLLV